MARAQKVVETALHDTHRKFRSRLGFVEHRLQKDGKTPRDSTPMEALWQAAKVK